MDTQEKIDYIKSFDFKVDIGESYIKVTDPLDKEEGFKLVGSIKDKKTILDETIEMIKQ